jgi:hypothetical protein
VIFQKRRLSKSEVQSALLAQSPGGELRRNFSSMEKSIMAKKITPPKLPLTPDPVNPSNNPKSAARGWGAEVVSQRVPSGIKLRMEPDDDCILRFVGEKDISEKMGQEDGSVVYLTFFDGERLVTLPSSYALVENGKYVPGRWYYIHHEGEVDLGEGRNPMKDFLVLNLGVTGESCQCPPRISDDCVLKLEDAVVVAINYNRLNYPLRSAKNRKPVE